MRKPIAIFCTCLAGAVIPAWAGGQALEQGRTIATTGVEGAAACTSCHGANGAGNAAAGFPRLAGLGAGYLAKQLDDMAAGVRPSAVMQPTAKALTPAQRRDVAAYYASLPSPYPEAAAPKADQATPSNRGEWLAIRGDWLNGVPACNQCHGPNGVGVGDAFPALLGQSKAYLAAQLQAWQQGRRSPLPLGLMPAVASRLTAADIDAVSTYYSGLAQSAAEQPDQGGKP